MPNPDLTSIISNTILVFLLGIFIILALYLYSEKRRILHKNIEDIKELHKKNILEAQLEIQEQTFQRISRDIHDNISLSLTLPKLNLATLDYYDIENSRQKIDSSIILIGDAIQKLSNISISMNSDLIKDNGLFHAIENELSILEKTEMFEIKYDISGDAVYLDAEKELVIFRIIQESLNNIIKHSKATQINIQLNYTTNILKIIISDNGKGFDLSIRRSSKTGNRSGLKNIESRIEALQGKSEIISQIGKGTTIKLKIPLITQKYTYEIGDSGLQNSTG